MVSVKRCFYPRFFFLFDSESTIESAFSTPVFFFFALFASLFFFFALRSRGLVLHCEEGSCHKDTTTYES